MSHYVNCFSTAVANSNFKKWWTHQAPCYRDGCTTVRVYDSEYSNKNNTDTRTKAFIKKVEDDIKKHGNKSVYYGLDNPNSYSVVAWNVGVVGWRLTQKKNRIINHKRTTIEESKDYKTKPSNIPIGAKLEKLCKWIFSYDGRLSDYEDYEEFDEYEDF